MKTFGHQRLVRDAVGNVVDLADSPARAVTKDVCGSRFGADSERKLVVSLEAGDLITIRLQGTRRLYRAEAKDVLLWMIKSYANRLALERARDRKAKKAERLAARRQHRAEKRLFKKSE